MNFVTYPSLRCQMGSWIYYTTSMRAADLVRIVKFAKDFFPANDLDKVLQRKLSDRSDGIARYLDNNEQRFFGNLIVAAYDGEPNFIPITFPDTQLLGELRPQPGLLRFDGSEKYYALDGQHRLAALGAVVAKDPERYAKDDIGVTIVCHSSDAEGLKRARRLFTTLNRHAKKTSDTENAVMDEDDPASIFARRLLREHPFFRQRIKVMKKGRGGEINVVTSESMSVGEKNHLMAFLTLRRCIDGLLPENFKARLVPQVVPSLDLLDEAFEIVASRWNKLIDAVAPWTELNKPESTLAALRTENGGHVLTRPIAIVAFVEACGDAFDQDVPIERIHKVTNALADITSNPWRGLLWNATNNKMFDGQQRRRATLDLWRYFLGVSNDRDATTKHWIASSDTGMLGPNPVLPDREALW